MLESHARLLLLTGRAQEAQAPIDEAIAIARELGAREIEAAALATRVIAMEGQADAAVEAGREALLAAEQHGNPETLMRAYINAAEALDHGGRVQDAIDLARKGIEESRRLGISARWASTAARSRGAWSSSAATRRLRRQSRTACAPLPRAPRRSPCTMPRRAGRAPRRRGVADAASARARERGRGRKRPVDRRGPPRSPSWRSGTAMQRALGHRGRSAGAVRGASTCGTPRRCTRSGRGLGRPALLRAPPAPSRAMPRAPPRTRCSRGSTTC